MADNEGREIVSELSAVKVGDFIAVSNRGSFAKKKVTKVSATRVTCGKESYMSRNGRRVGDTDQWNRSYAEPWQDEKHAPAMRKQQLSDMRNAVSVTRWHSISEDQIVAIYAILHPDNPSVTV
jgi:hypothetical protein